MLQFYDSSTVCFLCTDVFVIFPEGTRYNLSSRKLSMTVRLLLLKKVLFPLYKATLQICNYCCYLLLLLLLLYRSVHIVSYIWVQQVIGEKRPGSFLFGQINSSLQEQTIGEVLHMFTILTSCEMIWINIHFTRRSCYDILNMHLQGQFFFFNASNMNLENRVNFISCRL